MGIGQAEARGGTEQLKLVEKRGVKEVARVVAYRQIITIAKPQENLEFKEHQ